MSFRRSDLLWLASVCSVVAGAFVASRLLTDMLFRVAPRDPLVFATVPALLAAVSLVAMLIPAWRASGVNPVTALKAE